MDLLELAGDISSRESEDILLMFKNVEVLRINRSTGVVSILDAKYIPYGLYLECDDDIDTRLQNIYNFNFWCADRLLSIRRSYYKEIVNACGFTQSTTDRQRAEVALKCRCLSLQDQYWVKYVGETVSWEDVSLFSNSLSDILTDVCLSGKNMSLSDASPVIHNLTIDGTIPKVWRRYGKGLFLLKAGTEDTIAKEVVASRVLRFIGFNTVEYDITAYNNVSVTICKSFTDENIGFVTAEAYGFNNDLKALVDRFPEAFYRLVLSEYLIGNSDLHARNWGFLTKDGRVFGMAPLFDFDHAFSIELADNEVRSKVWKTLGRDIRLRDAATEALTKTKINRAEVIQCQCNYVVSAMLKLL